MHNMLPGTPRIQHFSSPKLLIPPSQKVPPRRSLFGSNNVRWTRLPLPQRKLSFLRISMLSALAVLSVRRLGRKWNHLTCRLSENERCHLRTAGAAADTLQSLFFFFFCDTCDDKSVSTCSCCCCSSFIRQRNNYKSDKTTFLQTPLRGTGVKCFDRCLFCVWYSVAIMTSRFGISCFILQFVPVHRNAALRIHEGPGKAGTQRY